MSCRPMFCEGRADCGDRHCPGHPVNSDEELTRRIQERELLWQCAGSGQCDSRQIASHIRAGELDGIGNECALPIIVDDIKPAPFFPPLGKYKPLPTDWSAITRWGAAVAVCVVWTLIVIYRK